MSDTVCIRGLDPEVWREVRVLAARQGMPVGKVVNWLLGQHVLPQGGALYTKLETEWYRATMPKGATGGE